MINSEDARGFADRLSEATARTVRDYEHEDVVGEESFTDELCGRLKEALEGFETATIQWQTDVALPGSGRGRLKARSTTRWKEEPDLGADFVMVLDIDTPVYSARKGFLAQAKRLDVGKAIDLTEHRRLIKQCEKMLSVTAASMVFLYSTKGVHVVPAAAVVQHKGTNLYDILTYSLDWLYHDFAICWFGDPAIQATDRLALEGLRDRLDARAGVRLVGRLRDAIIYDEDELIDPDILR